MQLRHPLQLLPILLLLLASACAHNPFKTAQTLEQTGDAWYGVYVIAKERSAALLKEPAIPDAAKRPLAEAMLKSSQPAQTLQDTVSAYSSDPNATNQQKLNAALVAAQPLINDLVAALVKAKPSEAPLAKQLEDLN